MMLLKSKKRSEFRVAEILKSGKIVILPTDTVYGFSGIALTQENALRTDKIIDSIKGSAEGKPLIELIAEPNDIYNYTDCRIPEEIFCKWPGPLTLIVENNARYKELTGRETTAFRCPGDEWLRKVVSLCGAPIYSTSVNRSGMPVLQSVQEIQAEFGNEVAAIVDGGDTLNAMPSEIVSLVGGTLRVVRSGKNLGRL